MFLGLTDFEPQPLVPKPLFVFRSHPHDSKTGWVGKDIQPERNTGSVMWQGSWTSAAWTGFENSASRRLFTSWTTAVKIHTRKTIMAGVSTGEELVWWRN